MTTKPKVYSDNAALASSVSRRLRKQSLVDRSSTEGSRVAGYPITYAGFHVTASKTFDPGLVAVDVTFRTSTSDRNHRREAAAELQAQRTVWLRSWLIEHGMDEWTIGDVKPDGLGDLHFVVVAQQGWR